MNFDWGTIPETKVETKADAGVPVPKKRRLNPAVIEAERNQLVAVAEAKGKTLSADELKISVFERNSSDRMSLYLAFSGESKDLIHEQMDELEKDIAGVFFARMRQEGREPPSKRLPLLDDKLAVFSIEPATAPSTYWTSWGESLGTPDNSVRVVDVAPQVDLVHGHYSVVDGKIDMTGTSVTNFVGEIHNPLTKFVDLLLGIDCSYIAFSHRVDVPVHWKRPSLLNIRGIKAARVAHEFARAARVYIDAFLHVFSDEETAKIAGPGYRGLQPTAIHFAMQELLTDVPVRRMAKTADSELKIDREQVQTLMKRAKADAAVAKALTAAQERLLVYSRLNAGNAWWGREFGDYVLFCAAGGIGEWRNKVLHNIGLSDETGAARRDEFDELRVQLRPFCRESFNWSAQRDRTARQEMAHWLYDRWDATKFHRIGKAIHKFKATGDGKSQMPHELTELIARMAISGRCKICCQRTKDGGVYCTRACAQTAAERS